jgi:aspartyl-tRNA(Asn)/glutamyl-tRNA(Gln) amidotransferase subunit A
MAGRDALDSTTIERQPDGYEVSGAELAGVKIGKIKEYFENDGLSAEVKKLNEQALEKLKNAGAEIVEVSLPSLPLALAVYYVLCPAEVSSNLSRYDGQRYGFSKPDAKDLADSYTGSREQGFGKEAKRRIMIGTYVLSSGYYDAYYKRAQAVRTKLIEESDKAFGVVDFLFGPTAADVAFKIGANVADPLKMYLTDIMTVAANLTGSPAISLPCGKVDGLPVGLQLIAPQRHDRELLAVAKTVEELIA